MIMEEFVSMLAAIRDGRTVKISYSLHSEGQLHSLIKSLGGTSEAVNYFEQILKAEAATIC